VAFEYLICSLVTYYLRVSRPLFSHPGFLSRTSRCILGEYRENRPFSTRPRDLDLSKVCGNGYAIRSSWKVRSVEEGR